jgi:hypothetical protein
MASGSSRCAFLCSFEFLGKKKLRHLCTFQQTNGTLLNYIDQPDSFADTSSTALLAASTFRYASMTGDNTHIPAAIRALELIRCSINDQGWLNGTVDPLKFSSPSPPGEHSPEGQSFVLLLEAAVLAWCSSESEKSSR